MAVDAERVGSKWMKLTRLQQRQQAYRLRTFDPMPSLYVNGGSSSALSQADRRAMLARQVSLILDLGSISAQNYSSVLLQFDSVIQALRDPSRNLPDLMHEATEVERAAAHEAKESSRAKADEDRTKGQNEAACLRTVLNKKKMSIAKEPSPAAFNFGSDGAAALDLVGQWVAGAAALDLVGQWVVVKWLKRGSGTLRNGQHNPGNWCVGKIVGRRSPLDGKNFDVEYPDDTPPQTAANLLASENYVADFVEAAKAPQWSWALLEASLQSPPPPVPAPSPAPAPAPAPANPKSKPTSGRPKAARLLPADPSMPTAGKKRK